jgi:hypothetical protein
MGIVVRAISHQSPVRVLGGTTHVRPTREVIEIKAEAILCVVQQQQQQQQQSKSKR